MARVSCSVTCAPDERLRAIGGPERFVVELGGVPHGLEGDLWHADGMGGWAWAGDLETTLASVEHVGLMVWGIEGLAVPAGGEVVDSHNASWAWLGWEVGSLCTSCHDGLEAGISDTGLLDSLALGVNCWVADCHAETRLESSNLLVTVGVEVLLGIVYSHTALDAVHEISIGVLLHTLVCAIAVLEVQNRSPIVREILGKDAGGAGSMVTDIDSRINRCIEHVPTNDLMKMCRW